MLIKNWIAQGMLPTASGKPMQKKKSSFDLALGSVSLGKPEGPPPMPKHLDLQPILVTKRAFAPSAMASAPGLPLLHWPDKNKSFSTILKIFLSPESCPMKKDLLNH